MRHAQGVLQTFPSVHAAKATSPFLEAGVAKAVFAANLSDRHTGFGLP
jgi:hypothetical protein